MTLKFDYNPLFYLLSPLPHSSPLPPPPPPPPLPPPHSFLTQVTNVSLPMDSSAAMVSNHCTDTEAELTVMWKACNSSYFLTFSFTGDTVGSIPLSLLSSLHPVTVFPQVKKNWSLSEVVLNFTTDHNHVFKNYTRARNYTTLSKTPPTLFLLCSMNNACC